MESQIDFTKKLKGICTNVLFFKNFGLINLLLVIRKIKTKKTTLKNSRPVSSD